MRTDERFVIDRIRRSRDVIASLEQQSGQIASMLEAVLGALTQGNRVYSCGNGGSAAEAMHLTEELIGRYRIERSAIPAVCLNADATALTCIANDFGFEQVFSRQLEALISRGDLLVAFSTSGASENVRRALAKAQAKGGVCIGLLGKGGGVCRTVCDHSIVVDSEDTEHIQEAHQVLVHLILEVVESAFVSR